MLDPKIAITPEIRKNAQQYFVDYTTFEIDYPTYKQTQRHPYVGHWFDKQYCGKVFASDIKGQDFSKIAKFYKFCPALQKYWLEKFSEKQIQDSLQNVLEASQTVTDKDQLEFIQNIAHTGCILANEEVLRLYADLIARSNKAEESSSNQDIYPAISIGMVASMLYYNITHNFELYMRDEQSAFLPEALQLQMPNGLTPFEMIVTDQDLFRKASYRYEDALKAIAQDPETRVRKAAGAAPVSVLEHAFVSKHSHLIEILLDDLSAEDFTKLVKQTFSNGLTPFEMIVTDQALFREASYRYEDALREIAQDPETRVRRTAGEAPVSVLEAFVQGEEHLGGLLFDSRNREHTRALLEMKLSDGKTYLEHCITDREKFNSFRSRTLCHFKNPLQDLVFESKETRVKALKAAIRSANYPFINDIIQQYKDRISAELKEKSAPQQSELEENSYDSDSSAYDSEAEERHDAAVSCAMANELGITTEDIDAMLTHLPDITTYKDELISKHIDAIAKILSSEGIISEPQTKYIKSIVKYGAPYGLKRDLVSYGLLPLFMAYIGDQINNAHLVGAAGLVLGLQIINDHALGMNNKLRPESALNNLVKTVQTSICSYIIYQSLCNDNPGLAIAGAACVAMSGLFNSSNFNKFERPFARASVACFVTAAVTMLPEYNSYYNLAACVLLAPPITRVLANANNSLQKHDGKISTAFSTAITLAAAADCAYNIYTGNYNKAILEGVGVMLKVIDFATKRPTISQDVSMSC